MSSNTTLSRVSNSKFTPTITRPRKEISQHVLWPYKTTVFKIVEQVCHQNCEMCLKNRVIIWLVVRTRTRVTVGFRVHQFWLLGHGVCCVTFFFYVKFMYWWDGVHSHLTFFMALPSAFICLSFNFFMVPNLRCVAQSVKQAPAFVYICIWGVASRSLCLLRVREFSISRSNLDNYIPYTLNLHLSTGPCQCKFGNPGLCCSIYVRITSNLLSLFRWM